jgi:WD40 repeat protein
MTAKSPKRASVFISYSRKDGPFAEQLREALIDRGFQAYLDREDILPGENWRARLEGLIVAADAVVFIISPDSIASAHCQWEVDRAHELNKIIAPARWRLVADDKWPKVLAARNAVLFDSYQKSEMKDRRAFGEGVEKLDVALNIATHLWMREHTKWVARAADWDTCEPRRPEGRLLRSADIAMLQAWVHQQPSALPPPPQVVVDYLSASIAKEERDREELSSRERRILASRQQLVARAAQEARRAGRHDRALRLALAAELTFDERERGISPLPLRRAVIAASAQALTCVGRYTGAHKDRVLAVALSDDATLLATASWGGKLRLWEVESGRETDALDRGFVAVGYEDQSRVQLDIGNGCIVDRGISLALQREGKRCRFAPIVRYPQPIIASVVGAVGTRALLQWRTIVDGDGRTIWTLPVGDHVHWDAALFAADALYLITVDNRAREHRGEASVWSLETGRSIAQLPCGADSPHGLRLTSNASFLVAARGSHVVVVDTKNWRVTARFETKGTDVLDLSSNGRFALIGSAYSAPRCVEISSMREVFTVDGARGPAVFDPSGALVAVGCETGDVKLVDATTGSDIEAFAGHEGAVTCLRFSTDGKRLVSGGEDGAARLWGIGSSGPRFHASAAPGCDGVAYRYSRAQFSLDGARLAAICSDHSIRVWSATDGLEQCALRGHGAQINAIAFSSDGSRLASGGGDMPLPRGRYDPKDANVRIWDLTNGVQTAQLGGHTGAVLDVSFSQDGSALGSASNDKTARLWDVGSGSCRAILAGHAGDVHHLSFSPDGSVVLTASSDESARVWAADSGAPRFTLWGWGEQRDPKLKEAAASVQSIEMLQSIDVPVTCARLSADGRRAVTNCARFAFAWDMSTGARIAGLHGAGAGVASAFSPDCEIIISAAGASADKPLDVFIGGSPAPIAKLWRSSDGGECARLEGHTKGITAVGFSRDGKRVVTSAGFETRLWDTESGLELACLPGSCLGERGLSAQAVATISENGAVDVWDARWVLAACDDDFVGRLVSERMTGMLRLTPDEVLQLEPILGTVDPDCLNAIVSRQAVVRPVRSRS